MKKIISSHTAPQAIGTYSQAILVDNTLYLSGQIGMDPQTLTLVSEDFSEQAHRVFQNLEAILKAAGAGFQDLVKLNVYLTDLANFAKLNDIMAIYVKSPYPARAAVQVSALPKGACIEIDGVAVISS